MRFELSIPDPATIRLGLQSYVTLKSGTELHRLHPDAYKPAQFNNTDNGNVLFGDRISAGVLKRMHSRSVSGGPCHGEIVALAQSLSIEYVDI